MCPPPNLTRTSPAAHPRSEMTYSFAVGVLPCAFACALLCVHASVDVYTQAKCVCTLEYAQGIHISLCRSSVAYTQLFLHVYLHMHKEYTPVVRCVYSICGRTFVFIYASNQVKIMLFFGCVYSFHPQNSLVLSFYPQNFSSFATNPPNIHIHGMSIHYGIEIKHTQTEGRQPLMRRRTRCEARRIWKGRMRRDRPCLPAAVHYPEGKRSDLPCGRVIPCV